MFKIQPIQSKEEQDNVARACGSVALDDHFAYAMRDAESDALMGFSQFEIGKNAGHITDIRPYGSDDDFEAMFILGRATMNFIDMCGVHIATASLNAGDETLIKALGFTLAGECYTADMHGMFNGECHSKN